MNATRPSLRCRAKLGTEYFLWTVALVCGLLLAAAGIAAQRTRRAPIATAVPNAPSEHHPPPSNDAVVMGRLTIPELQLSVPVLSDYDPASLTRGVGHIRGTAMPGGLGNMALAGHRDTYFRPLRRIRLGLLMNVTGSEGTFRYSVDSTEIVTPEQVSVLDIGSRPELTLITCYPFDYIGSAPKRFIVHAHLISVLAR